MVFQLSATQVLLLLINLVTYSEENRKTVMELNGSFGQQQFHKIPAVRALIEYFYKYEEMAR